VQGVSSCDLCSPGTFNNGFAQQVFLHIFAFSDLDFFQSCSDCPQGTFTAISGQTSCALCPNGTSQIATGQLFCVSCTPGQFKTLTVLHQFFYLGQYQDSEGQALCKNCPPGRYSISNSSAICLACPSGSHQTYEGHTSCDICPIGRSSGAGSDNFRNVF
jgi:hypothetical protein